MKLLVIPDIHENLDFLKYIMAVEDTARFDHVILLGDYFDRRDDKASTTDEIKTKALEISGRDDCPQSSAEAPTDSEVKTAAEAQLEALAPLGRMMSDGLQIEHDQVDINSSLSPHHSKFSQTGHRGAQSSADRVTNRQFY